MHSNIHSQSSSATDQRKVFTASEDKCTTKEASLLPHNMTDNNGIKKKKCKKVACVGCHKAHARCDRSNEQRSCSRCIKLGIQCVEQVKKKSTREERMKTLQEQRKNSLNMKILPRTHSSNHSSTSTTTCSSSSTTSTSPHTRISPSTPSQLYSGSNPFSNGTTSPSLSSVCSQSSSHSSSNSEMQHSTSSNNSSPSTVTSNGLVIFPHSAVKSPNPHQLISYGQSISTSTFQNNSPHHSLVNCGENNSSGQPNTSFQNPFVQQIMAMRNCSPYYPVSSPFNSHALSGNNFPTQSTTLGLSFNSSQEFQPQPASQYPPQPSFIHVNSTNGQPQQHMYSGKNPIVHEDSKQCQQATHHSSHSNSMVNNNLNANVNSDNNDNYLEADNQSSYTSRIFPSSSSMNAQITEMLDSYSLPNPDDLEQLISSLENARNV